MDSVGFGDDMRSTSIASLSGGWKMKLALGGAPPPGSLCLHGMRVMMRDCGIATRRQF